MKKITIEEENIGSCTIISEKNIPIANEFAIKALISIQLLLLESDSTQDNKIRNLIKRLDIYSKEISEIWNNNE